MSDNSPSSPTYNANPVIEHFDAFGVQEWERCDLASFQANSFGCIALTWNEVIKEIRNDADKWGELLRMELEACAEEGCLNMGTHLIAVVKKEKGISNESN